MSWFSVKRKIGASMRVAPSVHGSCLRPKPRICCTFPGGQSLSPSPFLEPGLLPQKFHCRQRLDKLRVALDAPLGSLWPGRRSWCRVAAWRAGFRSKSADPTADPLVQPACLRGSAGRPRRRGRSGKQARYCWCESGNDRFTRRKPLCYIIGAI